MLHRMHDKDTTQCAARVPRRGLNNSFLRSLILHVCEQPHTISAAAAHSTHAALNTIFGPKYLDNRSSERFDMIRY